MLHTDLAGDVLELRARAEALETDRDSISAGFSFDQRRSEDRAQEEEQCNGIKKMHESRGWGTPRRK